MTPAEYAAATGQSLADAERQIDERLDILWNVDARECEACGRQAGDPAGTTTENDDALRATAFDPGWYIENVMVVEDGETVHYARVRCPECR